MQVYRPIPLPALDAATQAAVDQITAGIDAMSHEDIVASIDAFVAGSGRKTP